MKKVIIGCILVVSVIIITVLLLNGNKNKSENPKEQPNKNVISKGFIEIPAIYEVNYDYKLSEPSSNGLTNLTLSAILILNEDQTATYITSDSINIFENSSGTYEIIDNNVIYTRKNVVDSKDDLENGSTVSFEIENEKLKLKSIYFNLYSISKEYLILSKKTSN